MPQDQDSILERLLRELQNHSEGAEDKNTRQLFTEVRDELRKLNEHFSGSAEDREAAERFDELSKRFPALKTRRRPARRRTA
jgi:hypothetical protein